MKIACQAMSPTIRLKRQARKAGPRGPPQAGAEAAILLLRRRSGFVAGTKTASRNTDTA